MGTALLETSKIGIPTVIVDPMYNSNIITYKYRFLYEEKGYCLGLPTWLFSNNKGVGLNKLLSYIEDKSLAVSEADLCYNYTLDNHDIKKITKRLIDVSYSSNLYIKNLFWLNSFYYIKEWLYRAIRSTK
jgi:hypothetical protein